MKQTYFREQKYSKNYLVPNPQNTYEQYVNAYAFSKMVESHNIAPNKKELQLQAQSSWREVKKKDKDYISNLISNLLKTPIQPSPFTFVSLSSQQKSTTKPSSAFPDIHPDPPDNIKPSPHAPTQNQLCDIVQKAKAEVYEYTKLLQVATSSEVRSQFSSKIKTLEETITIEEKRLKRLKNNAAAQKRSREKKKEKLEKENIVEVYNTPGRPSYLMNDPNLLEKMHSCIEFGAADYKRRKEVIKVRTIKHLREAMENNYNEYMSRSTVQNYMQPRHPASKEAHRHHHPAQIRLAAVGKNEMRDHVDEHYCLASVKGVKLFASAFSQDVVLISQDDKAKVPLGIAAVGKTFKTVQTSNEPVSIPDHDFPVGSKHKLIPSVYLLIDPNDTNDSLRSGKLRIFIRPEYFLGTSCETHMVDLMKIVKEEAYHEFTHHEGSVKPIWCLLTDGGPDENPRFLANILKYMLIFKKLKLDYLTVRTHAPGQSAYNPVERSMSSLSSKLAGIVLNAFNYGNHLGNVNGQVSIVDEELGYRNFKHAGEHLCELWNCDFINKRPVVVTYIEKHDDTMFSDIEEGTWDWIDRHSQICKYSFDLRKCNDRNCCDPPRAADAFELLSLNNGFLPPIIQGQDKHFLNLIHTLEFFNDRLPGYDEHCPSISSELYHELVCQKCGKYFPTKAFIKMHVKNMHPSERGIMRKIDNNKQSMTSIENHDTRNELADHTGCVDQSINHMDNKIATMQIHKQRKGKDKAKNPWDQDYLTFQI